MNPKREKKRNKRYLERNKCYLDKTDQRLTILEKITKDFREQFFSSFEVMW